MWHVIVLANKSGLLQRIIVYHIGPSLLFKNNDLVKFINGNLDKSLHQNFEVKVVTQKTVL